MRVLGVQVGKVAPLQVGDREVMSGIRKRAVSGIVGVTSLGLAGDEQADLTVHGGLAKAVYAYPVEHYEYWRVQRRALGLADDLPYGSMGENLTLTGVLEEALHVGDLLRLPHCVLRVTQPRSPCHKFVAAFGDREAGRKMIQTGFRGFYLAVDAAGHVEAGQEIELVPGPRETRLASLKGRTG